MKHVIQHTNTSDAKMHWQWQYHDTLASGVIEGEKCNKNAGITESTSIDLKEKSSLTLAIVQNFHQFFVLVPTFQATWGLN